jgi:NAD(P)H-dependent FMN reductase
MAHITLLVGSWNKNKDLAQSVEKSISEHHSEYTTINIPGLDLPLFTSQNESKNGTPECVRSIINDMQTTDAFIAICPEYNGSIPPTFNNFIAWISRASSDWRAAFNGKGAALMSYSGSGTNILQVLRLQMAYIGCNVVGRQLLSNSAKPPKKESIDSIVSELIKISTNRNIT